MGKSRREDPVLRASRSVALALSLNRIGFGLTYALRPARGDAWIGTTAHDAATKVIMRGHGARDVGLGCGALTALVRGDERSAGVWLCAQVLADCTDLVATLLARGRLPARGVRLALLFASTGTAAGSLAAAGLTAR